MMNAFNPSLFSSVPGVRCCDCPGCYLTMPTLLVDGTTTEYADSTTATTAIADQTPTGCLGEGIVANRTFSGETRTVFSTDFSSGTYTFDSDATNTSGSVDGCEDVITERIYLTAADGLSIVYNLTGTWSGLSGPSTFLLALYEDDETTLVDSVSGGPFLDPSPYTLSGTFSPTISADGYYRIVAIILVSSDTAGTWTTSISLSATGGSSILPCSARAAYDDGMGGTAYVICT